ncbi:MAG: signal peptidase II [Paracoccaceae bacterium]|nr:signal peptidase II [Paracoccaceae bacterium]
MQRLAIGTFLVLVLDQLTKIFVVHWMDLKTVLRIEVFPPFLNFQMAWNRGVNFGLLSGDAESTRWILIIVALAISAAVVVWVYRSPMPPVAHWAAGLIVGGALGNVIDRLLYGAVADFLNMSCCGVVNPFSFNIADVAIFVGAIGLVFFGDRKNPA